MGSGLSIVKLSESEKKYKVEFALVIEKLINGKISYYLGKKDLVELKEQIEKCLDIPLIKENFNCSTEIANEILDHIITYKKTCTDCVGKYKNCLDCIYKYKNRIENYLFRRYISLGWSIKKIENQIELDSEKIAEKQGSYPECNYNYQYEREYMCDGKNKYCYECIFICQSPLERKLYMGLVVKFDNIELQKRINKDGSSYDYPEKVVKSKILTMPDFFIQTKNKDICIYADGFTYHNKEEKQVMHDNNIDRELQKLGYVVLRFSTKEIYNGLEKAIDAISDAVKSQWD